MADASQLVFSIPSSVTIPGTNATSDTNRFLTTLSNWMQTREGLLGDGSQKVVTLADLQELGLVPDASKGITQTYDLTSSLADSEGPGAPRDLVVTSRIWANELSWTNPTDDDLSHIEVWCATASQSRDDAELIALVTKPVVTFSHGAVSTQQSHTYWIRAVDYAGNHSAWCPPDAQGGYVAPPGLEHTIAEVLAALQGRITEDQLYQALVSRINALDTDGITIVPDVFESGVIGGLYDFYLDGTRQDLQFKSDVATLQATASDHFSRLTDLAADSANLTASLETLQTALGSLQDDTQSLAAKDVLLALDISGLHSTAQAQLDRIEALDAQVSVLIADDFDVNNFYTVGQYVRYDGKIYCCIQDITSTPAPLPTETAYWKESPDIVSLVGGMETRVDALENRITTTVSNASFNLLTSRVTAAESTLMQQADEISLKVAQGSFDLLQGRVSGAEADIAVQAEQITSKVDQDTFNVLQGRVTTAESSIVQNANAITLAASQADLDTITNQVSSLSTTVGIHSGSFEVLTTSIVGPIALLEGVAEHGIMAETFADVAGLDNRLSLASLRIDSAEANINLRATQASVDSGINSLSTRIGNAELDINAAEGVLLQHTQRLQDIDTDLDSVKDTAAKAAISIDALSGITLANSIGISNLNNRTGVLEGRIDQAQIDISALNGVSISHTSRLDSLTSSVSNSVGALSADIDDNMAAISAVDTYARAVNTTVQTHTGNIAALRSDVNLNIADITSLETVAEALESRVGAAELDVDSLQGITASHTTSVGSLVTLTTTLQATSDGHAASINSLNSAVASQGSTISGHTASINGLNTTVGAQGANITTLTTRTTALETRVGSAETRISSVEGVTSTHTTRISSLTDSVTTLGTNSEEHTSQINDLTDAADALDVLTSLHTGQLNNLATLTGTQTADIDNLLSRTTTLETRVSGAETSVNSLTGITGTHTTRLDTLTATTNSLGVTSSTHTTQISSAQTSLNAIKGQWTVKLQQDGTRTAVAGVGLMLDPLSSASEFMVIADKFMVVDPATSSGAAPLVPFVIGEVAGQYAVGIDGNLVVDGTIMGRHIDAGAITAAHLAADLAVVNTIRSGNYSAGTTGWKFTGTGGEINSGVAINGNLLVNGSVTGQKIAANSITAANIAAATITGAQIKANSLNASTVLASNSIGTSLLQADSITADKIAAGAITADSIAAHCITSDQIVVDGVDIQSIARGVIKEFVVSEGDVHNSILTAEIESLSKAIALIFLKHTRTTSSTSVIKVYRNGVLDRQVILEPPGGVEQNQTYIVSTTLFGVGIYCSDELATAKILLISYK